MKANIHREGPQRTAEKRAGFRVQQIVPNPFAPAPADTDEAGEHHEKRRGGGNEGQVVHTRRSFVHDRQPNDVKGTKEGVLHRGGNDARLPHLSMTALALSDRRRRER